MKNQLHSRTQYLLKLASDNPSHGYLFIGHDESQKKAAAFEFFAKLYQRLNFEKEIVEQLRSGRHQNIIYIEPDEKDSIKLGYVKEALHPIVLKASQDMPLRLVVVSRADRLTIEAANSLLKTLEEPATGIIYVLTAKNALELPRTIVSRLQIIEFLPTRAASDDASESEFNEAIKDFLTGGITTKFALIYELSKKGQLLDFLDTFEARLQAKAMQNPRLYSLCERLITTRQSIERNVNARLAMELLALEMSR